MESKTYSGSLLKEWLKSYGVTQQQFANQIGCSTAFLNSILNGKNSNIKIDLINRIVEDTGIPAQDLIDDLLRNSSKNQKQKHSLGLRRKRPVPLSTPQKGSEQKIGGQ